MTTYRTVAKLDEIPLGQLKQIELEDGGQVCLANVDGQIFAIDGECPHAGGPLGEGRLEGYEVFCPWHEAAFDLRNGQARRPPADGAVACFEIRIERDQIQIRTHD